MADPAPRPRLPAPERRAAILEAAVHLFSKRGFRGTTTRELAGAVGVTEPVLYQHFETKGSLYTAILEDKISQGRLKAFDTLQALSHAGDNRGYFRELAGLLLDWYIDDPRYARLLMYSSLEEHELSDLFYERHVVVFYDAVTGHLRRQMEAGVFKKMDSLLAARCFTGMVVHQGNIYAILRPGELPGGRDAVVETVVDIFLSGIAK